ncbi:RHS repeat-associated core domain-containing protein [uncultured Tolumonas sp.]|uniref:RHS repeat-associated core domain-containing protein n=1 Tax=uncultured Tolumonas sp. TaxID=263765 RepID=UPI002931A6E4|nr:RHS repeat-associated core domain-containing protein [uncultured Tolumonas sp.]
MLRKIIALLLLSVIWINCVRASPVDSFELLEATPGKVYYLSTPGRVILLHGEIVTPIVDNSIKRYFSLVWNNGKWALTSITAEAFSIGSLWSHLVDFNANITGTTIDLEFAYNKFNINNYNGNASLQIIQQSIINDIPLANPNINNIGEPESSSLIAGSINGDFSVNKYGEATYDIPVKLSEWVNGFMPKISVSYSSNGAYGLLGWGWKLNANSMISRCSKALAFEGEGTQGHISYTASDRLCLDGRHLFLKGTEKGKIVSDSEYWGSGKTYYVDNMPGLTVYGMNPVNSSFDYLYITDKNHIVSYYGKNTGKYQRKNSNQLLTAGWAIDSQTDRFSNSISYFYNNDPDQGSQYLSKITYGGKSADEHVYSVSFSYIQNPKISSGYVAGTKYTSDQLLTKISVKADDEVVSDYNIGYQTVEGLTPQSYLNHIQQCFSDKTCYPASHFSWYRNENATTIKKDSSLNIGSRVSYFVDMTGDGKADLVYLASDNAIYLYDFATGNNQLLVDKSGYTQILSFADADNDGVKELIASYGQYAYAVNSHGEKTKIQVPNFYYGKLHSLDINGDGKDDLISKNKVIVSGLHGVLSSDNIFDLFRYVSLDDPSIIFSGDLNGDKATDLYIEATNGQRLYTNISSAYGYILSNSSFIDINNDGLSDRVNYKYTVKADHDICYYIAKPVLPEHTCSFQKLSKDISRSIYSQPLSFQTNTGDNLNKSIVLDIDYDNNDPSSITYADINNDGINDILVRKTIQIPGTPVKFRYEWTIYLVKNTSDTLSFQKWGTLNANRNLVAADIDGDGQVELIGNDADESLSSFSDRFDIYRIQDTGTQQNKIASIEDGLHHKYSVSYSPVTDRAVLTKKIPDEYYKDNSLTKDLILSTSQERRLFSYPYVIPLGGTYVVNSYEESGVNQETISTKMTYEGILASKDGSGFLGFESIKKQNLIENSLTVDTYSLKPPYSGFLQSSTYFVNNKQISKKSNTWLLADYVDGGKFVYLAGQNTVTNEYNSSRQVGNNHCHYEVDEWGNITEVDLSEDSDRNVVKKISYKRPEYAEENNVSTYYFNSGVTIGNTPDEVHSYVYNAQGWLTEEHVSGDANTPELITAYNYDNYGNVIYKGETDTSTGQSRTINYRYSQNGRLLSSKSLANQTYNYQYNGMSADQVKGRIWQTTKIDPNDHIATQTFEADGTLHSEVDSSGLTINYSVDLCASNCPRGSEYYQTIQQMGAPIKVLYFNGHNLPIQTETTGFDGRNIISSTEYDWRGLPVRVYKPHYEGQLGYSVENEYDAVGRKIEQHDYSALGDATTTWQYSGMETTITNSKQQQRIETYNELQQLIAVKDDNNSVTEYTYNPRGLLLTTQVDGNSNTKIINTYNSLGRKIATQDPTKGNWQYRYNAFGDVISQINANGKTIQMTYDALGRLISRRDESGISCNYYDQAAHAIGQLIRETLFANGACNQSEVSSRYSRHYSYDQNGRLNSQDALFKGQTLNLGYSYDSYGRISQISYPAAEGKTFTVRQQYSQSGYLNASFDNETNKLIQRIDSLDASGNIAHETLGNNVEINNEYIDGAGVLNHSQAMSGRHQLLEQTYQYDMGYNLTERTHNYALSALASTEIHEKYQYDNLNRLTEVGRLSAGNWLTAESYRYDKLGNITYNRNKGEYHYDSQKPYRLNDVGVQTFSYDQNGNVLSDGQRQFSYDASDMPLRIQNGSSVTEFAYGPDQARYWRKDVRPSAQGQTTLETFYLDKLYEKIVRSGADGALTEHKYYVGPLVLTRRSNGTEDRFYQHTDALGSVLMLSDQKGQVAQAFAYSAFGKARQLTVDSRLSALLLPTRRGYTGHETVEDLDVIHMNGRIFDPTLGRFLQADPYIPDPYDGQSYNRYSYVRNNPLNATDPTGFADSYNWGGGSCTASNSCPSNTCSSGSYNSGSNSSSSSCSVVLGCKLTNSYTTEYRSDGTAVTVNLGPECDYSRQTAWGSGSSSSGNSTAVGLLMRVSALYPQAAGQQEEYARIAEQLGANYQSSFNTIPTWVFLAAGPIVGMVAAKSPVTEEMAAEMAAERAAERAVAKSVGKADNAPDFVVSPSGTAFPVPKGATGPTPVVNPAGKKTGDAFTGGLGGVNGQVDTMRMMDPTPPRGNSPGYPNGYIKYENKAGQGVDPYTGRTLSNKDSHFPID